MGYEGVDCTPIGQAPVMNGCCERKALNEGSWRLAVYAQLREHKLCRFVVGRATGERVCAMSPTLKKWEKSSGTRWPECQITRWSPVYADLCNVNKFDQRIMIVCDFKLSGARRALSTTHNTPLARRSTCGTYYCEGQPWTRPGLYPQFFSVHTEDIVNPEVGGSSMHTAGKSHTALSAAFVSSRRTIKFKASLKVRPGDGSRPQSSSDQLSPS